MKKITFLFLFLAVTFGYSQTVLEDFEGAAPMLVDDAGITSSVTADPVTPSENSMQLITAASGQPWQGAKLIMQNNKIDMTTTNKVMSVDVYSTSPKEFLAKLSDGDVGGTDPAQESKTAAAHGGTGWETLTFDFNVPADTTQPGYNPPNDQFSSIVFFPLYDISNNGWCDGCGENNALDTTTYVDNVTGVAGDSAGGPSCTDGVMNQDETGVDCGGATCPACPAAPTVAAPAQPYRAQSNVRSIFCDEYNDISVDTYDTPWCSATTSDVLIDSNPTKRITGLGCEGIEFVTGRFDATNFAFFHMDIWTDSPTMDKSFNFKFSNWTGGGVETNAFEYSLTNASSPVSLPNPNPGTWISIDLNLSDFTTIGSGDTTDFVQFVITSDLGTVYYDNLYLHNANLSTDEFETANFKVYPNPTANNWNIESNTTIRSIVIYDILGKKVSTLTPNSNEVEISSTNINTGLYFAKIEGDNGSKTVKLIKE